MSDVILDKSIRVRMKRDKIAKLKWAAHKNETTYAGLIRKLIDDEIARCEAGSDSSVS